MQQEPVVGLYLDTRYPSKKNGGKFRGKVRVTFQVFGPNGPSWDPQYYGPKVYFTEKEFEQVVQGKAKGELRDRQELLLAARAKASDIIRNNRFISIKQFEIEFNGVPPTVEYLKGFNEQEVKKIFLQIIAEKDRMGKIGTRDYYKAAMASILFYGGEDLSFKTITPEWCKSYEIWCVNDGNLKAKKEEYVNTKKSNSLATASANLRALRRVCKIGIKEGSMTADQYPFGKGKYMIRKKRNKKIPLTATATDNILDYKPVNEAESQALDYSVFSYLSHGMNFADIAFLHERDFRIDHFKFIRRKTKDTVLEQKEIKVHISKRLRDILNRRANHKGYVFGIIDETMDEKTIDRKIEQFRKNTNKWLRRIAEKVGYEGNVSTQILRHTFTSRLLNAGVPITKVADSLGHTTIITTQDYSEDLDFETAKSFDNILTKKISSS
jgi:integrase/recombinase XerD